MANPIIAPVIPNFSAQAEAVAGSQGVVFTATDRKVIEERGGEVDQRGTFLDALAKRPLNPEVENEETTVKPETNVQELAGRYRDHKRMLKYAPLHPSHERVEITNALPDTVTTAGADTLTTAAVLPAVNANELKEKTISLAKELRLDPAALFDKFTLEQSELYGLIYRIKELHFQRLLSEKQEDFEGLTAKIRAETLGVSKPAAKRWVEEQLELLTVSSVNYKIKLIRSMQSLDFDKTRETTLAWLKCLAYQMLKNAK